MNLESQPILEVFTNAHFSKEVIPIWDWATEVGTASNRPRISEMAPDFLIRLPDGASGSW
jgi:hypothetical protein